jgi:hypothetical protein
MTRLILPLVVGLACTACGDPKAQPPTVAPLTVRELWSAKGTEDSGYFGTISGAAVVDGDRIWVSDPQGPAVLEYSLEGAPIRTIAREGDGPGEVRSPTFMTTTPSGRVAVYDLRRASVEMYEPNGEFLQRIKPDAAFVSPKGMAAADDRVYMAAAGFGSDAALHEFDAKGTFQRRWYPMPTPSPPVDRMARQNAEHVASGPIDLAADGALIFSQSAPHKIMRFPPGDTVGTVLAADPDVLQSVVDSFAIDTVRNGRPVTMLRWFFPQSRGVFELSDGKILNIITLQDLRSSIWQLYAPDGLLTAVGTIPEPYWPWDITDDDDVIVTYRDPDTDEVILARLRWTVGGE